MEKLIDDLKRANPYIGLAFALILDELTFNHRELVDLDKEPLLPPVFHCLVSLSWNPDPAALALLDLTLHPDMTVARAQHVASELMDYHMMRLNRGNK